MKENHVKSMFLIPMRTDTVYWRQTIWKEASCIRFLSGGIKFQGYTARAPMVCGLVIFDPDYKREIQDHSLSTPPYLWHTINL